MDKLTFIAAIVKAVTWPAVIAAALILFKEQLTSLLTNFSKRRFSISGAGSKLIVSEELDKIEEIHPPLPALNAENSFPSTAATRSHMPVSKAEELISPPVDLSNVPPDFIISQAWSELTQEFRRFVNAHGIDTSSRGTNFNVILNKANQENLLLGEEVKQLRELQSLRNSVVHTGAAGVSLTDALRYRAIATSIAEDFRSKGSADTKASES